MTLLQTRQPRLKEASHSLTGFPARNAGAENTGKQHLHRNCNLDPSGSSGAQAGWGLPMWMAPCVPDTMGPM